MAYYAAGCLKCRKDPAGDESHVRWGKYSMNYRIYLTAPQLQTPEALLQRRKGSEGEVREGEVLLWSGGAGPPKAGAAPHTVLCKHTGGMWYCLWGRRVRHPECTSVSDELSSSPLDGEQPAVSILTWAVSFLPIEKPLPQASTHWLTVAFPRPCAGTGFGPRWLPGRSRRARPSTQISRRSAEHLCSKAAQLFP